MHHVCAMCGYESLAHESLNRLIATLNVDYYALHSF